MSSAIQKAHYSDTARDVEIQIRSLGVSDRNGWDIAAEHVRNYGENRPPCVVCKLKPTRENKNNCQRAAAMYGQDPKAFVSSDGMERFEFTDVYPDAKKPTIFRVTTPLPLPPDNDVSEASSPLAAFQYANNKLGVGNYVTYGSDQSPMPIEIIDYWLAQDQSPFTDPRLKETRPIYNKAIEAAAAMGRIDGMGQVDDVRTLYRLASIAHITRNAEVYASLHEGVRVIPAWYDSQYGQSVELTSQDNMIDLFHGRAYRAQKDVYIEPLELGTKLIYPCLCCDARASNVRHFFGKKNVIQSNSVSILVAPKRYPLNATWLGINRAVKRGATLIPIIGHSDCGGIRALIDREDARRKEGRPKCYGRFINPWLDQGESVVAEVFDAIDNEPKLKNISDEDRHELVTRRIKMWSAVNVNEGTPGHVTSIACFEDLIENRLEYLPLGDSIVQTYARMKDEKQKIIFPEQVRKIIEAACPMRESAPAKRPFDWLLTPQ